MTSCGQLALTAGPRARKWGPWCNFSGTEVPATVDRLLAASLAAPVVWFGVLSAPIAILRLELCACPPPKKKGAPGPLHPVHMGRFGLRRGRSFSTARVPLPNRESEP